MLIRKADETLIPIENLVSLPTYRKNLILGSIELNNRTYWGFNRQDSSLLLSSIQKIWYEQKHPAVDELTEKSKVYVNSNYVRSSTQVKLQSIARKLKDLYKLVPPENMLLDKQRSDFLYVERLAAGGEQFLDDVRESFIKQELSKYSQLFDTVETNELTEKQRRACVIDNDNNLVLAGAGTGKSSTIIGKAGYLVESNRAKPEEILLLAFGNKAAEELQDRIVEKLKDTRIQASTFHKLGKSIIAKVEKRSPAVSDLATDDKLRDKFVNDCLNELLKQPEFGKKAVSYFEKYLYPDANPFDFKSKGEYLEYIIANEIRTLKGEAVKSHGELLIANFLFVNGIEYRYEMPYEINTSTSDFRQYKPDFYLVEHEIYIEHFGIDRNRNTAPYIDREKYNKEIDWKLRLHNENNTICIQTFHYEKLEGRLISNLHRKLTEECEIEINPLPEESILDTLREFGQITALGKLLSSLLSNVKSQCSTKSDAIEIAKKAQNSAQAMAALDLLIPVLDSYEDHLARTKEIDFNDMIHKATKYVKESLFKPEWKYILVDEFQDISYGRAELIISLRNNASNCSIFCVGDDWQSIYRFAGSDLSYTTSFEEIFGNQTTTSLDKTFRFNNSICDIASKFVTRNGQQVRKTLVTNDIVANPAVSVVRRKNSCSLDHVKDALDRISSFANPGATVYVISRYNFLINENEFRTVLRRYPNLKIKRISMHGSKGKQADYVIIVGLERGKSGFPSEKVTHPLLELYLPPIENYPHAEERRLFYVAITRAKKRVYLIADMEKASVFMNEILKQGEYDLCLDEFETPIEQIDYELLKCPDCKTGTLTMRENKSSGTKFLGCSNWSLCEYTEPCCPKCSSTMKRVGRFKQCVNCGWKIPMCPVCNGEMRRRPKTGHWGCSNYRGKNKYPTCTHQESTIHFD